MSSSAKWHSPTNESPRETWKRSSRLFEPDAIEDPMGTGESTAGKHCASTTRHLDNFSPR